MTTSNGEAAAIAMVIDDLGQRLPDAPPELVHQVVADVLKEFVNVPVREFAPLLVGRMAAEPIPRLAAEQDSAARSKSA